MGKYDEWFCKNPIVEGKIGDQAGLLRRATTWGRRTTR